MNSNKIKKHLNNIINEWSSTIVREGLSNIIKNNTIITGGSIVSLLNNETPNDYDIYFKDLKSLIYVVDYYVKRYNINNNMDFKLTLLFPSDNVEYEIINFNDYEVSYYNYNLDIKKIERYETIEEKEGRLYIHISTGIVYDKDHKNLKKNKDEHYEVLCLSSNAITLTNNIQIIIRFYGNIEKVHKNFDFVHCTCSYDNYSKELVLPNGALESIINKELVYIGSKYPITSIMRMRKFINRGYNIHASSILKIVFDINKLCLNDINVLRDQLIGIDYLYFSEMLIRIENDLKNKVITEIDSVYLYKILDTLDNEVSEENIDD